MSLKICIYYDSCAVMACAKFCSPYFNLFQFRTDIRIISEIIGVMNGWFP